MYQSGTNYDLLLFTPVPLARVTAVDPAGTEPDGRDGARGS